MTTQANELDGKAKGLAADYLRTEGQLLEILMTMRRQRVFAELNYTGVFDYCERALKLSRAQAYYFKSVAEKSEEVPQIRTAILSGELTLSQARRIVPVVNRSNQTEWIEKAKTLSQKALEREVTAVNPQARVLERIRFIAKELSELKVPIDRATEQNLEVLKDLLSQRRGHSATLAEVIAWISDIAREKFDPVRKAARSSVSSGNLETPKPGRHVVPAPVKHAVVARDNRQCTHVSGDGRRCASKRWLHLHHEKHVEYGGLNTTANLRMLCAQHHQFVHAKLAAVLNNNQSHSPSSPQDESDHRP